MDRTELRFLIRRSGGKQLGSAADSYALGHCSVDSDIGNTKSHGRCQLRRNGRAQGRVFDVQPLMAISLRTEMLAETLPQ